MEAGVLDPYLAALRHSRDDGCALAAECYRDPAAFSLEVERVLRPAWHALARWDDLPEPGDYAAVDLFDEPLVVLRDEAQRLRVFSRVCRHRGHTLVEGRGHADHLVCPYHRWTYGLDGRLRGAPLMGASPAFDADACGLPELRTESWQGFLMASLDPEPPPFASPLAALDERMASLRLDEMVTLEVLEFDSPWNWKVMVDNFMESYHHMGAHRGTLQPTNPAKDTYCADLDGPFALIENPGAGESPSFIVAQVFPTLLFFANEGAPFAGWYQMQIDRHDHLHLRIHSLAAPELAANDDARKAIAEGQMQVHLEDIPVCESVQRGLSSRLYRPGPLAVQERCLTRFHAFLLEQLGA